MSLSAAPAAQPHPTPEAASPPAAAVAPAAGMPAIDALRFLSVCAVVWFHAGGSYSPFFTFRLPAIAIITALVQSRASRWRPWEILRPWLFWYAVYLLVLAYKAHAHGADAIPEGIVWYDPLVGPARHLWYGPFALAAGYVARRWRPAPPRLLLLGSAALFGLAYALRGFPIPASQWGRILPAIGIGALLASEGAGLAHLAPLALLGALAVGPQYVAAIGLVWLAKRWKGQRLKNLATFSRGVYWAHPLGAHIMFKLGVASGVTILLAAFALAGLLMATPWTRRLV